MAEQEGDGGNGALSDAPLPDAPMDERPMAAAQEAETERERARADSRETREAEDANGGDSVGAVHDATSGADGAPASAEDTAAEERRKRRERRRGLAWDKDAQGNAVAPAPLLAVASAHVPGAALGALAPLAVPAPAPSPLQQQATLTRRARRLHVGSLPPGISIQLLRDLFNSSLLSAGLTIGGAPDVINDVQMGGEGKFAFIEFRSVREATSALALDGLDLLGRKIRVQRPNDFVVPPLELHAVIIPAGMSAREPQAAHAPLGVLPGAFPGVVPGAMPGGIHAAMAGFGVGVPAYALGGALHPPLPPLPPASVASALNAQALAHAATNNPMQAQLTAHQISRKARRLHVGNLPQGMGITPAMLKQFFNATLMATGLVDPSKPGEPVIDVTINTAGKFAFAEFRCIAEATSALTLNNVELAGRQLRVERPRDYTPVATSVLPDLERAGVVGETPICNMQQIAEHCASGGGACVRPSIRARGLARIPPPRLATAVGLSLIHI